MDSYSLMVARFPGQNQEHPASAGYVMGLMETLHNDDRVDLIRPFRLSDTPITMSRNRCVREALENDIDYVLMIDSDMSPDCEPGAPPFWETAWNFMMERRANEEALAERLIEDKDFDPRVAISQSIAKYPAATIAAPYCGPPPHECVYVFRWESLSTGDAEPSFRLTMFDRDDAARKTGIEEVAALPTGLILYDTRVFRRLPVPWFDYEWKDSYRSEKASTEDVYQTRNASIMGFPQYVAWDCWAGHVKQKIVTKPQPLTIKRMQKVYADAILRTQSTEV